MQYTQKKILLLLCGDAALMGRDGVVRHTRNQSDMEIWLANMPELSFVAQLRGVYVPTQTMEDQAVLWQDIARIVGLRYREADGFVVLQAHNAVAYTAAALTLMLKHLSKPVIIVGMEQVQQVPKRGRKPTRPASSAWDLEIRANMVNAVQFATLDLCEVTVLKGNVLYHGATYTPAAAPTAGASGERGNIVMGRIDFGLKLGHGHQPRVIRQLGVESGLKTHITHYVVAPSIALPDVATLDRTQTDGMLVTVPSGEVPPALLHFLRAAKRRQFPVALYAPESVRADPAYLVIRNVTPHMALVKFMWALGQERRMAGLQRLLDTDIAGEMRMTQGGRS